MARADLILNLVRASRLGDEAQLRKTVEALAANERAKNHTVLANRLLAQLEVENGATPTPFLSQGLPTHSWWPKRPRVVGWTS